MKKLFGIITILSLSISGLFAQNDKQAESIINDFISTIQDNAIKADFTMKISDPATGAEIQSQKGNFIMKSDKFVFSMEEIQVFFNGKTQWTYMPVNNEVTITEPGAEELAEINPLLILSAYKEDYITRFSETEKSAQDYIIEMKSNNMGDEFDRIEVRMNKTDKSLSSIKLFSNSSYNIFITLKNFKRNIETTNNTFIFDKKKHKDVFENDMR